MPPLHYDMKSKFGHQHTVATLATGIGGPFMSLLVLPTSLHTGKSKHATAKQNNLGESSSQLEKYTLQYIPVMLWGSLNRVDLY